MNKFDNFCYGVCFVLIVCVVVLMILKPSKPRYYIEEDDVRYEFIEWGEEKDSLDLMKEEESVEEIDDTEEEKEDVVSQERKNLKKTMRVTITKYNPTKEQCDDDFLITADNSEIDLQKLNSGELRWIAVSRDLRKHFPYGSKIVIHSSDPELSGVWEVHDTMNERWTERIDLLRPVGETKGKWEDIKISLLADSH